MFSQEQQSEGSPMTRMDTMAWYGRMGLIAAAFALVGGIVAAPMLTSLWTSSLTIAQR